MNDLHLLPVEGEIAYTFDFSDVVIAPATVTAIVITAGDLTAFNQTDDLANKKTTVGLKGAVHGVTYNVQARATLSNGEKVPKDATFVGFNG